MCSFLMFSRVFSCFLLPEVLAGRVEKGESDHLVTFDRTVQLLLRLGWFNEGSGRHFSVYFRVFPCFLPFPAHLSGLPTHHFDGKVPESHLLAEKTPFGHFLAEPTSGAA